MKRDFSSIITAVVDDEIIFLKRVKSLLEKNLGLKVYAYNNAQEFLSSINEIDFDLLLLDLNLPDLDGITVLTYLKKLKSDIEVIIVTGHATVDSAVEAIKIGAKDYLEKPLNKNKLFLTVNNTLEKILLKRENIQLKNILHQRDKNPLDGFIANCQKMIDVTNIIKKIAPLDCNVLIEGETGTGKEMVARAIHKLSKRSKGPFISINCGGFSEELITNELFGHEKEAFTGAHSRRIGLIEAAQKGTLFLDEIGEMPPSLQVKLLKVIEEKRIYRLGSNTPIDLDIRIIAATNRDLKTLVKEKLFREDLYFRLNVVNVRLPKLKERPEDIPVLISHFISKYNKQFDKQIKGISNKAASLLLKYDFPGNVRELENIIQRAVALCDGQEIKPEHLPSDITNLNFTNVSTKLLMSLEEIEKNHIKRVLEFTGYDKKATAAILKIPRTTLWRKMKKYNL